MGPKPVTSCVLFSSPVTCHMVESETREKPPTSVRMDLEGGLKLTLPSRATDLGRPRGTQGPSSPTTWQVRASRGLDHKREHSA